MRVLVTGITGMLGKDIASQLSQFSGYEIFGISRSEVSIGNIISGDLADTDFLKQYLKSINPDLIIHCAASVNVDACEENKNYTNQLHVEATKVLATFSSNTKLVYIST